METDPETGAIVLFHVRWRRAVHETRDLHGIELPDRNSGDALLADEFMEVGMALHDEKRFADRFSSYAISIYDTFFNSLFNDPELYTFVGLLYLARHFADPLNRSAFLSSRSGVDFTEKQLLKLVSHGNINDAKGIPSPRIAKLTNKILETSYITHHPAKYTPENEHLSPGLQKLREGCRAMAAVTDEDKLLHARVVAKHFHKLEKRVVELYKLNWQGPHRHLSEHERCHEEKIFSLKPEEAQRLLGAARTSPFFYDLISKKPPEAKCLSHEQALFECGEHARLWLFSSRLQVYYNFSFTYAEIGKAPPNVEEIQAWSSPAGFMVKLPSREEKRLRRAALGGYCEAALVPGWPLEPIECSMEIAEASDLPEKVAALKHFLKPKVGRRKRKREARRAEH